MNEAYLKVESKNHMKTLDMQFTKNGFNHRQIARDGKFAVYAREKAGNEHWEVVVIGSHNGFDVTNPTTGAKTRIQPAETYPSSEQWGCKGFTCQTKDRAWEKFDALRGKKESL